MLRPPFSIPLASLLLAGLLGACAPRAPHAPAVAPAAGVARRPEHLAASIAALGWPGAHRAFQIGAGSVVYAGDAALEWRLPGGADSARTSPVWFERDGVPVAHWTLADANEEVAFEAACAPRAYAGDTSLVLSVRAVATWRAAQPGVAALELRVRGTPAGACAVPWDAATGAAVAESWRGHAALRAGRVVATLDPAFVLPADAPTERTPASSTARGPGALHARGEARLAPGEQHAWEFRMPLYPLPADRAATLAAEAHAALAGEARGYWRGWLSRAAAFATPDSDVTLAWRAALVTLGECQERRDGDWVPIGSPFQYRDVWLRDGARVVRALAVAGLLDVAASDARTLARFQLPGGAFLSQRGQLDGTGQALWALAQVAALAPESSLARPWLPAARRALGWIAHQRALTRDLGLPTGGLLPWGEPRDAELVRASLVGNDAWAIAGCDAAAELGRLGGDPALASEAAAQAADYRARFAAALAANASPDVPPSWDGGGRDAGNLAVAYPTAALPPGSPRVAALSRRAFARGEPSGLVCYGPDDSLHTYLGADLAERALLVGDAAGAQRYLAGLLARSSSTLGQAEIVAVGGGFGANLPPHATAAATLVDLLRNMLVRESGDTLEVAGGAPLAWWSGAGIERAPTRFGLASVTLARPAAGELRVALAPLPAPVRVRVPDGVRALGVRGAGARLAGAWVELPAGSRAITIEVAPAPGGAP